jgi:hypothetical protein
MRVGYDQGTIDVAFQRSGEGAKPGRDGGWEARRQQFRRGLIARSKSAR